MSLDPGMQQSGGASNQGAQAFGRGLAGSGRHQHLTLPQMFAKSAEQTPAYMMNGGGAVIGRGGHMMLAAGLKLPPVDKAALRAAGLPRPFAALAKKILTAGLA